MQISLTTFFRLQLFEEAEELKVTVIQSKANAIADYMSSNEYLLRDGNALCPRI